MINGTGPRIALIAALLGGLAACGGKPYVYNGQEFDRSSKVFREGVTDRNEVTICSAQGEPKPAEILALARAECRRFGKTAVFNDQSLQICPLTTPMAAIYDCLGTSGNTSYRQTRTPEGGRS